MKETVSPRLRVSASPRFNSNLVRRLRLILVSAFATAIAVYLSAFAFGRGGRGEFSPDTLEYRTRREWCFPLYTDIPLWRGVSSTHRPPLVEFLIAEGYWSPVKSDDPRWLPMLRWNDLWRDGHNNLHRVLSYDGDWWMRWSHENPAFAKVLWPMVLAQLQQPNWGVACELMGAAARSDSLCEFESVSARIIKAESP